MFRVFNMGIGMVLICAAENGAAIRNAVNSCYEIGHVTTGQKTVSLI
jgi:phosphoribosylaminoimidazole (AIR) synthetase